LAVSFLGSIIGVYLTQENKDITPAFFVKLLKIGLFMFVVGLLGCVANLVVMMMDDFYGTLMVYKNIWDHRAWTAQRGVPFLGWLFQFSMFTGFSLCCVSMLLRVIEFRGISAEFARKTTFIRRFGFVAFTVYNNQWIYFGVFYLITRFAGDIPYQRYLWGPTLLVILISICIIGALLWLWEKVGYIGAIEWWIGVIGRPLRTASKPPLPDKTAKPDSWVARLGGLDVTGSFKNAEWVDILPSQPIDQGTLVESRLARKVALTGLVFFPIAFVGMGIAYKAQQNEEKTGITRPLCVPPIFPSYWRVCGGFYWPSLVWRRSTFAYRPFF